MPGTDGPGQFPDHNRFPAPSSVRAGRGSLPQPQPQPQPVRDHQADRGTSLPPSPSHTHPHSFRKPKCSLSRHISFVSRKKYANDRFLHFSAESLPGRLGWRHRVRIFSEGGGGEHQGGLNPNARLSLGISLSQRGLLSASTAPPAPRHTTRSWSARATGVGTRRRVQL